MGTFGKALGRELGKNTGKAISNFVFGDSWATPYRRVSQPSASAQLRAETARITASINYETKIAEINARKQWAEEQHRHFYRGHTDGQQTNENMLSTDNY